MNTWYLVVAVALLLANGFFVGAEFALVAARRSKIESVAETGDRRARAALASLRELSLMLAGAQLGITLCSIGLGAIAEPAVAHLIESGLDGTSLPEGLLHSVSFVIALTIVVFFHMVVGEMAPKNIAIAEPEKSALWFALPFRFFTALLRPFIHVLNALANGGVRLMGVEPQDELRAVHSAEEIGMLISESARHGVLSGFEHRLLTGAISIRERDAGAVMVPRTDLVAVPLTSTPADVEEIVLGTGRSRIPVYAGDLDHIVGFFHAKDLLKIDPADFDEPLSRPLIRQMLVVPESRKVHPLLFDMQKQRRHFALVIDEHGGTAGVVTLEDLLEELVGEIRDESDDAELGIERLGPDRFVLPGSLRIDEVAHRIGLEFPEGEYETVAGFLMDRLGRIPKRRDRVEHNGWAVRVLTMHRRRVVQVLAERLPTPSPAQDRE